MVRAFFITSERIAAERERVAGNPDRFDVSRVLAMEELTLPDVTGDSVRARVLAASIEHNTVHAALADSVDIVSQRGGRMIPGNCFVGEVLETGPQATRFRPGDIVLTSGRAKNDPYGYPVRIPGYDDPHVMGCFGEETLVPEGLLRPAPLECGLTLWQLAAAPLRAATANHLWRRGEQIYRVKVPRDRRARLNVLAFGGGTSEMFLMLARSEGHRAFYCSANPERCDTLAESGIEVIDQRPFRRFSNSEDVRRFGRLAKKLTRGEGMHVVCDMFRGPVFDAGIAATARQGVNVSAGWQLSTEIRCNSAALSLRQITLDCVHFETLHGCEVATDLLGSVFCPAIHDEVYALEDLPRALRELHESTQTGVPTLRVAHEMPDAVRHMIPVT